MTARKQAGEQVIDNGFLAYDALGKLYADLSGRPLNFENEAGVADGLVHGCILLLFS